MVKAGDSSEEAGTLQGEQGVKCSLCNGVVEAEKFSEHLSDYHAEERCDSCGARVPQKLFHHLHGWHHLCSTCHLHLHPHGPLILTA